MGSISISLPSDGTTADVADYNTPLTTIATVINGNLDSNNLASNAVTASKITDGAVTPAKLQSGTGATWAWQTWTPTWTNLTVGNGTVTAKYVQTGKTVRFSLKLVWGSTTAITGADPTFTFPVTTISANYHAFMPIGTAGYNDASAGAAIINGFATWATTTTSLLVVISAAGTYGSEIGVTSAVPFTWTTGDTMFFNGTYEAA